MRVLLVEDHAGTRLIFEAGLKKLGHEVRLAAHGGEAWEILQAEPFDLVISDWMMPEVDGVELCRRIRADAALKETYIILLTALAGKERYLQWLEAGADDCMKKPFAWEEMHVHLSTAQRILSLQAEVHRLRQRLGEEPSDSSPQRQHPGGPDTEKTE